MEGFGGAIKGLGAVVVVAVVWWCVVWLSLWLSLSLVCLFSSYATADVAFFFNSWRKQ